MPPATVWPSPSLPSHNRTAFGSVPGLRSPTLAPAKSYTVPVMGSCSGLSNSKRALSLAPSPLGVKMRQATLVRVKVPNVAVALRGEGREEKGAKANPQTKIIPLRLFFLMVFPPRLIQVKPFVNLLKNALSLQTDFAISFIPI